MIARYRIIDSSCVLATSKNDWSVVILAYSVKIGMKKKAVTDESNEMMKYNLV